MEASRYKGRHGLRTQGVLALSALAVRRFASSVMATCTVPGSRCLSSRADTSEPEWGGQQRHAVRVHEGYMDEHVRASHRPAEETLQTCPPPVKKSRG